MSREEPFIRRKEGSYPGNPYLATMFVPGENQIKAKLRVEREIGRAMGKQHNGTAGACCAPSKVCEGAAIDRPGAAEELEVLDPCHRKPSTTVQFNVYQIVFQDGYSGTHRVFAKREPLGVPVFVVSSAEVDGGDGAQFPQKAAYRLEHPPPVVEHISGNCNDVRTFAADALQQADAVTAEHLRVEIGHLDNTHRGRVRQIRRADPVGRRTDAIIANPRSRRNCGYQEYPYQGQTRPLLLYDDPERIIELASADQRPRSGASGDVPPCTHPVV